MKLLIFFCVAGVANLAEWLVFGGVLNLACCLFCIGKVLEYRGLSRHG